VIARAGLSAVIALAAIVSIDAPLGARLARPPPSQSACEGARATLPDTLLYELRSGAFPDHAHPDVAVHVPPGFDATRRPGVVLYFHGWQGCVAAALASDDVPCSDAGPPRAAANLASAVDAAGVNALLVAVELRVDMATGEPGRLAMPAGLRDQLRELFVEHLAAPLGCTLEVDALDRVVVIAHSGGYQAAASALSLGDVPRITEVVLLDALYGGENVFLRWMRSEIVRFDTRAIDGLRFVDFYTCCGGTAERSRTLARGTRDALTEAGLAGSLDDDDGNDEIEAVVLAHPVVFKRVPRPHSDLPRAYLRTLVEAAGFARIEGYGSHSLRLK
jgi:hypothetical protein